MTKKQSTKSTVPPCVDGTQAHHVCIKGENGELRGVCKRCQWGREYSNRASEAPWNVRSVK